MRSLGNWKITQMFQESYLDDPGAKMLIKVLKYFKEPFRCELKVKNAVNKGRKIFYCDEI